MDLMWI